MNGYETEEHICSRFTLSECGECYDTVDAPSLRDAYEIARDSVDVEDYIDVMNGKSIYVEFGAQCADKTCGDSMKGKVCLDPPEPECSLPEHEWKEFCERCNGGGVIISSSCAHCDWVQTINTWDQSYGYEPRESLSFTSRSSHDGTDVDDEMTEEDIVAMIEEAGYGPKEIKKGIAYANSIGYETDEEYFSLIMSRILYSKDQLDEGARFGVEPGSLG